MNLHIRPDKVGSFMPVTLNGKEELVKIVRSASVSGGLSDDIDSVDFNFYSRRDHQYVKVVANTGVSNQEHHWEVHPIITAKPEDLRRIKDFLSFAKSLGIAATCLANMIKGVAPH